MPHTRGIGDFHFVTHRDGLCPKSCNDEVAEREE